MSGGAPIHRRLLRPPADPAIVRLGEELARILADEDDRRELAGASIDRQDEEKQQLAAGGR